MCVCMRICLCMGMWMYISRHLPCPCFSSQIMQNPKQFVTKQRRTRLWLRELRKLPSTAPALRPAGGAQPPFAAAKPRNLRLFILSNADFEHVNAFMSYSYGGDWLTLFDLVIVNAKKRTFYEDISPRECPVLPLVALLCPVSCGSVYGVCVRCFATS